MKALVAGATGRTGRRIVEVLHEKQIPLRALVRDLDKGKQELPAGIELVQGDVGDRASLEAAIADCTVLLCATGASPSLDPTGPYRVDYLGTQNLIAVSQAAGIEQFVLVSSLCVSQFFHPLNLFWLVLYWKLQAEIKLKSSGLTYTIVRPGGLLEESNDEPLRLEPADTLFDGRIPRRRVAEVAVEALFQPAAQNRVVEIVTTPDVPAMTWEELFARVA
ncbi:MAG: NAD(P)H-binding protein [Spirulinaceae cyanobacterium RM2_2_10]|nr:NAD(P)H-binding protein [Spirulinaceae cyanobacterium SM2_1_0]NJO20915.1 NAD(P)H-binding protein [Spirulinaceae cyanobacterium RM2_2_10]